MRALEDIAATFGGQPIQLQPLREGAIAWRFQSPSDPDREALPHYDRPFVFIAAPHLPYRVEVLSASYVSRDVQGRVLGEVEVWDASARAALVAAIVHVESSEMHGARLLKLALERKKATSPTIQREGEMVRIYTELSGRIVFLGEPEHAADLTAENDPFEAMLQGIVGNYDESRAWRARPEFASRALGFAREHLAVSPYLRVESDQRGPVRLLLKDLYLAGVPERMPVNHLALWRAGERVPLLTLSGDAEAVYFFNPGQPPATSRNEVYLLTWNNERSAEPGHYALAQAPPEATPYPFRVEERFEEDKAYYNETVGGYEGTWYWRALGPGEAPFFWHNWMAENLSAAADGATAEMAARIYLVQRPPTRFVAKLNGHELSPSRGETGRRTAPVVWEFPAAWLTEGRQSLEISLDPAEGAQGAAVELDWFTLAYPQATRPVANRLTLSAPAGVSPVLAATSFTLPHVALLVADSSGHAALARVEAGALRRTRLPDPGWGGERNYWFFFDPQAAARPVSLTFRPPLAWCMDTSHADLAVLCADEFVEEASRLIAYHAKQGYAVRTFTREALYDAFNFGLPDVRPLKDLLAWGVADWRGPLLTYALLVGDAAFDWKNDSGSGVRNYMPIYNPPEYPLTNSSDQWLSYLCGDDSIPDLVVSRLSCASRQDLAVMIDNLIDYETRAPLGPWRIRALMVGDDEGFAQMARQLADRRVVSAAATRVLDQGRYPYTRFPNAIHGWLQRQALPVRDEIVAEMNDGLALLNWYGHAAPHVWSHERVFKATEQPDNDMRLVRAEGRLAFVTNFSCRSGWINLVERPFNICLAEDLMRHPGKGAIGVLAPSGATGTSYHEQISDRLMEIFFRRRNHVLGTLVTQTKVEYHLESDNPSAIEVSDQFILVGDPLVRLALPEPGVMVSCTPEFFAPGRAEQLHVAMAHPDISEGTASLLVVLDPYAPMVEMVGEPITAGAATFDLTIPATQTEPIRLYGYFCNAETRQESMGTHTLAPAVGDWRWEVVSSDGHASLHAHAPASVAAGRIALEINGKREPDGSLQAALPVADATTTHVRAKALNDGHPVAEWEGTLLSLGPGDPNALLVEPVRVEPNPVSTASQRAVAKITLQNLSGRRLEGLRARWSAAGQSLGDETVSLAPGERKTLERVLRPPFNAGELDVRVELLLP